MVTVPTTILPAVEVEGPVDLQLGPTLVMLQVLPFHS